MSGECKNLNESLEWRCENGFLDRHEIWLARKSFFLATLTKRENIA